MHAQKLAEEARDSEKKKVEERDAAEKREQESVERYQELQKQVATLERTLGQEVAEAGPKGLDEHVKQSLHLEMERLRRDHAAEIRAEEMRTRAAQRELDDMLGQNKDTLLRLKEEKAKTQKLQESKSNQ